MICAVVTEPTLPETDDYIELRADYLGREKTKELLAKRNRKVILTLRATSQGGKFLGSLEQELDYFAPLSPEIVDIDDPQCISSFKRKYPHIKILFSQHLQNTPKKITLKTHPEADYYKLVTYAESALDGMRLLKFLKECVHPLTAFCMGEEGVFTRLLAPIFGSQFSYFYTTAPTAAGQLSYSQRLPVNKETKILGLIGDPVDKSPSRKTHQSLLTDLSLNALYTQFKVSSFELISFLELAQELNFYGLSVTMPHKEQVAAYIQSPERAINTLKFSKDKIEGLNTDGVGAMRALNNPSHQKIVILGAGGAAYGIGKEALKSHNQVLILNRTLSRAKSLAKVLSCQFGSLDQLSTEDYAILINTLPIAPPSMKPNKLCLEVITHETPFSLMAKENQCIVIPGYAMFVEQAKRQFSWWYPECKDFPFPKVI